MKQYILSLITFLVSLAVTAQPEHRFDANNPDVHDPVMARGEDGRYYIFSTGMGISVMSSSDMKTWRQEPGVFAVTGKMPDGKTFTVPGNAPLPQWTTDSIHRFHGHIWAPDISYHNGKWYLYYSCSSFGKNGSAIGLATNKTLDPSSPYFKWEDQGCIVVSHRNKDEYNCIDPNLAALPHSEKADSANENKYLTFGSFWDGIQMMTLADDYKTPLSSPVTIARRYPRANNATTADKPIEIVGNDTVEAGENAIEAPFIINNNGWYYLFVSWDYCCRGRNSTYKTVYGRSRNITGPYLDKEGKDMTSGGGTFLVGPDDKFYGIGHCSAYQLPTPSTNTQHPSPNTQQWYFISHAYDISKKGQSKLFIRRLCFSDDGWLELKDIE